METNHLPMESPGVEALVVPDVFTIGREHVNAVPEELRQSLAPARWILHEWTGFQLSFPETTHLRIGSRTMPASFLSQDGLGHFQVRFENELGLTTIQPLNAGKPSAPALHIEVIAKKFRDIHHSLSFMHEMLTDLFARGATLPFDVTKRTRRTIRDERRAPNDLFAFHFFRHHHEALIRAIQAVQGSPHRVLSDRIEHVRIHEVKRIDSESLLHLLQTSNTGQGSRIHAATSPLRRLQPERVLQRIPEESYDTPENRFIVSITRRMYTTIRRIRRTSWFRNVQEAGIVSDIPNTFDRLNDRLRQLVTDPRFAGLEESVSIPAQSRVLQRKDGYRELTQLWDAFHRYQEPVYEDLERAIDIRDIPTLYEFWLLFELIDGIQQYTGIRPQLAGFNELGQPGWSFTSTYPSIGQLTYQASYGRADIYSGINLRPDFVWETEDGRRTILDAKFALSYGWPKPNQTDESNRNQSRATSGDVGAMHGYRDAIRNVSAAIILYPGNNGMFHSVDGESRSVASLTDLLPEIIAGTLDGIGSIPMSPVRLPNSEGTTTLD